MVLERHPKKYKHLMRTMVTQLIEHENITTTKAKAKHLRSHSERLFHFAKKAYLGQTSPLNLLKGRVHTEKAYKKLLIDLMPRLKNIRRSFIDVRDVAERRRGDNAPMVQISIKGNEKTEFEKKRRQEAIKKGEIIDKRAFNSKILKQQKSYLEQVLSKTQQKQSQRLLKNKIKQNEFQTWLQEKNKGQPPKYTLLI